jgi:tetratricopeptide (TPR) repeat protein
MANFANAADVAQLKMSPTSTLKATDIHVQAISFEGKAAAGAATEDLLDRLARAAQTAQAQPDAALRLGAFDADFSGLAAVLGDEGPEGPLLREARKLIADEQYKAALQKLEEVFAIDEHHHEAVYLVAYCQFRLEQILAALKTLLRLLDADLNNRLRTRVSSLKAEIRQRTMPRAARIYARAVKSKQTDDALSPLREFAETDPEVGKFHFFLAGVLVVAGKMDQARQVAGAGLAVCQTERDELEGFLRDIEQRFLPQMLKPARDLFREQKYTAARKKLQELDAQAQQTELWRTFDGYLERLTGGSGGFLSRLVSRKPQGIDPPGTPEQQQTLYEYLVNPELRAARKAIEDGDHRKAERALEAALAITPAFSLINHMSAVCVYQRVGEGVKAKIGSDLDAAGADRLREYRDQLLEAHERAVVGSRDPSNTQGRQLVQSIETMRREIEAVVDAYQKRAEDADLVNEAVDDFIKVLVSLMGLQAAAGNPWQVRSQAEELYNHLSRMSRNLPKLKRKCHEAEARDIMTKLQDFTNPILQVLKQAMGR